MGEIKKFPDGFLWGAATSSYQVEGGIENNDWAAAAREGKIPAAGRATDHYNLYESDFDIAKSLGHNAHRLSIEWARIEPEEGKFDESEIEHYRRVLATLRAGGLEPFVTLWHFTLPVWFSEMGGFENKKAPFYFARYCEYVVSRLAAFTDSATAGPLRHGSREASQRGIGVKFWITINEPMVYAGDAYKRGKWPPFEKNFSTYLKVINNLITSHNVAYDKIKSANKDAQIGIAKNFFYFESNNNPYHLLLSMVSNWFFNHRFLSKIRKRQDFVGVNYYRPWKFGIKRIDKKSDLGWDIYPSGVYNVLMSLKRYRKPIYITENGLADAADTRREKFISDHLYWAHRAMEQGVDLRGYLHWSLLDNFEWADGFGPRFGLVEVDYATMERRIRPSAYEYKKICESNTLISELGR